MEETTSKSNQRVPFLGDIPILGHLFRYDVDSITKKELIIIITPYVITNASEADKYTQEYMSQLRELRQFLQDKDTGLDVSSFNETNSPQTNEP